MSIVAIDTLENPHHLDHLIPLCHFFNAKLLIRDIENKIITKKFYPQILIEDIISLDHVKDQIGHKYNYLIHSFFWPKQLFRTYFHNHKIKSIYSPHGNSDKHSKANWMTKFAKQEFCLIYGNNMMDFLIEEKVFLKKYAFIGNLRYRYYQENQNFFYKNYTKSLKSNLSPNKKTILYAPTKKDESMLSSFDEKNIVFFRTLADEFNLIIKLHPHFIQNYPTIVYPFFEKISKYALVIEDNPLIYPLLDICDALITDYSSVGYDFLAFDRPLFFLQTDKKDSRSTQLHHCGIVLDQKDLVAIKLLKEGLKNDLYSKKRNDLYKYTFHSKCSFKKLPSLSKGGKTKIE
jgi:teichoic acid glycerol-phosphate primase